MFRLEGFLSGCLASFHLTLFQKLSFHFACSRLQNSFKLNQPSYRYKTNLCITNKAMIANNSLCSEFLIFQCSPVPVCKGSTSSVGKLWIKKDLLWFWVRLQDQNRRPISTYVTWFWQFNTTNWGGQNAHVRNFQLKKAKCETSLVIMSLWGSEYFYKPVYPIVYLPRDNHDSSLSATATMGYVTIMGGQK